MEGKDQTMETSSEAQSRVLSVAVARIAALWSIDDDLLGDILGIAVGRAEDLRNGTYRLARPDPAFRAGQYLVRLFQELGVLIGDDRSAMTWLQTENMDLGGRPIDLVRTEGGLRELLTYVETRRASS